MEPDQYDHTGHFIDIGLQSQDIVLRHFAKSPVHFVEKKVQQIPWRNLQKKKKKIRYEIQIYRKRQYVH